MRKYDVRLIVRTAEKEHSFVYSVRATTPGRAKLEALLAFVKDQPTLDVENLQFKFCMAIGTSLPPLCEGDRVSGIVSGLTTNIEVGTILVISDAIVIRWDNGMEVIYGPEDVDKFGIRKL